jgi:glycosyltransferase involved in cell wall biosynthesis
MAIDGTDRPLRVAMLAPSPVPFKVPLYRRISDADGIDLTVMYASSMGIRPSLGGYGQGIVWDTDLLDGYRSGFLRAADQNAPNRMRVIDLADPDVIPWLFRGRFDVLWSEGYSWITNLLGIITQRSQKLGVVIRDTQNLLHPRSLPRTLVKEVALRALFSKVDAAAYISRENRRWLEHYGIPAERLFSSPYGPDSAFFAGEAERLRGRRAALRTKFGFDADTGPIVLSVSRLVPAKQPAMVLQAFRHARSRHRCGLLMVGSGELEPELRATIERQQIPDVRFAGFLNQSEVAYAYAAADVFTMLSAWGETFGVAVAEAMYFGLPLLLSDKVGSAADLLGDAGNGFLVARDDVDGAGQALATMVGDGELRARFSAESLRRISQRGVDRAGSGAVAAIRYAAARAHARGAA